MSVPRALSLWAAGVILGGLTAYGSMTNNSSIMILSIILGIPCGIYAADLDWKLSSKGEH